MSVLQLVPAELVGIIAESFIYGAYVVMFAACMYVLAGREMRRPKEGRNSMNIPFLVACGFLFLAITTHWGLNLTRTFHAMLRDANTPGGPSASYGKLSDPLNVAKTGVYIVEIVLADMIMVYRLWVIWNHNISVCVLPICCVCALLATGTGITYQFTQTTPGEDVFGTECGKWITSSFTLTLCTNIYCTILLSYKIWSVNRAVRQMRASRAMNVISVVVESAAIYTAMSLSILVSYVAKSNAQFIFLNATSPVIGLVFCMIIVRVGLGLSQKDLSSIPVNPTSYVLSTRPMTAFPMTPVAVTVTQQVNVLSDEDFAPSGRGSKNQAASISSVEWVDPSKTRAEDA